MDDPTRIEPIFGLPVVEDATIPAGTVVFGPPLLETPDQERARIERAVRERLETITGFACWMRAQDDGATFYDEPDICPIATWLDATFPTNDHYVYGDSVQIIPNGGSWVYVTPPAWVTRFVDFFDDYVAHTLDDTDDDESPCGATTREVLQAMRETNRTWQSFVTDQEVE